MRLVECVQGTPEWWEARLGVPSASNFDRIFAAASRKPSRSQDKYIAELIEEIRNPAAPYFTTQGGPVNPAIEHGQKTEDEARYWYAFEKGCRVQRVGFCLHDSGNFGCSPDGLVGDEWGGWGLELKCPQRDTHLAYLDDGKIPNGYLCQVHGGMIVTGRQRWDFMSYYLGENPLIVRAVWNDFTIALSVEIDNFVRRYHAALAALGLEPPRKHVLDQVV